MRPQIERRFAEFCEPGACAPWGSPIGMPGAETGIDKGHESEMTFLGLLVLDDPLRAGIVGTLQRLQISASR